MIEKIDMYRSNYLFYYDEQDDMQEMESVSSLDDQIDLTLSYWMPL